MTSEPQETRRSRIVSWVIFLLASSVVGYAVSDDPFLGGEPGFGKAQLLIFILGIGLGCCIFLPLRWRVRALLCATTMLASLGLAEFAAGRLLAARYVPPVMRDDRLLFKPRPGGVGEFVPGAGNGQKPVRYRINSDGFRGGELQPRDGRPRVMVYGDSFIQANYTPLEHTFCKDLERELGARLSQPVEVLNAGVSGYGPDQIALKMEDEIPRFQPDLVIVSIFAGNDFGDLERNKLFRLDPDGNLVANKYTLSDELKLGFALSGRQSILKCLIEDMWSRRRWNGPLGDDAALRIPFEEHEDYLKNDRVTNLARDSFNADCSLTPNSASAVFRARFMEAVLERIRDTAARFSVPLVLMFIPYPSDVCVDYDGHCVDTKRFPDYHPENLTRTLAGIADRHHMTYLDLFDAFRRVDANRMYYHHGNDHWNDEGQRLAAVAMCDFVIRHGLCRPCTELPPESTERRSIDRHARGAATREALAVSPEP